MQKAGKPREMNDDELNVSPSKTSHVSGGSGEKRSALLSRKSFRLQRSDDREFDIFEILTCHTWYVCRVSPLFGLQETEARLKLYAMFLRGRFAALKLEEDVEYKSEVVVAKEGLKTENDLVVKVEVRCRRGGEWKPIYVGFLLSWGSLKNSYPNHMYHLPILLYKGQVRVKEVVHDALQKLFDCNISQCFLTQNDFMWLNSIFISACGAEERGAKIVKINLRPPWKSDSHTEYKISFSDLSVLWKRVHSEDSDVLVEEEVQTFYNALIEHARNEFKINLECFKIDQITYPAAGISASGKLRCKSAELWNDILSLFYSDFHIIDISKMSDEDSFDD